MEQFPTEHTTTPTVLIRPIKKKTKSKKNARNTSHRNYCFTLNNPHENCSTENLLPAGETGEEPDDSFHPYQYCVRYVVYQLEVGRDGTPHYQGYIEFYFARTIIDIRHQFDWFQSAHFEVRKGTQTQAIAYCTKEDTRVPGSTLFIYGIPANQGARTDLEDCKFILDASLTDAAEGLRNLSQDYYGNFLRYHKGFARYQELHLPSIPRRFQVNLIVLLGPPGAGKSTWVRDYCLNHELNRWNYPYEASWWNGYNPHMHRALVLDEFYGQVEPSVLNQLCDVDRVPLNVKYAKPTIAGFTHVFVISNLPPRQWWPQSRIPLHSFYRRITQLLTFYLPFGEIDIDAQNIMSSNEQQIVCPQIMAELLKFNAYA